MRPRADSAAAAPRAWQRMLSGRRLDLLDPSPLDIEIEDIAHGLARVARWNGQTRGEHIFSVAQHTLLTAQIARGAAGRDRRLALAVLLHDAPEYVIGDMISPFKVTIGGSYKAVERRLLDAIHLRFGLPPELPARTAAAVKAADRGAAFLEATALAGFSAAEARRLFGPRPALPAAVERDHLTPWPAEVAKQRFLRHFHDLHDGAAAAPAVSHSPSPLPEEDTMIHVCSLARLPETVARTGSRHVVSLIADDTPVTRPAAIAPADHLVLEVNDIIEPLEGHIVPEPRHVRELIAFVQRWPRQSPLVIHCLAGISRSTAAAFVAVCVLNPEADEHAIARTLRRASPSATPNSRIVAIADDLLGRRGRMVSAIRAIGTGRIAQAEPFAIAAAGH